MWQFVALRGLSSRGEGLTHVGKLINICSAIEGGMGNAKRFRHADLQSPWEQECWKQPAASVSRGTLGKSITQSLGFLISKMGSLRAFSFILSTSIYRKLTICQASFWVWEYSNDQNMKKKKSPSPIFSVKAAWSRTHNPLWMVPPGKRPWEGQMKNKQNE